VVFRMGCEPTVRNVMDAKRIAATALLMAMVVFGWSMGMAALGHAALIVSAAPVLGLTVQQIVRAVRSRPVRTVRTDRVPRHRVVPVPDKEDSAV
jgi:hypothetical protein